VPHSYHHIFEPGSDPSSPPILTLHGTGGTERDLVSLAKTLSPGSAILSPRGDVSERGAWRFFARLAEGVFDPDEIRSRTHALADFITETAPGYGIDSAKMIAIGFSNGANIAATLMLLRPETLGGGILLRPMVVLDEAVAPGSLAGRRVLICSGDADPIVPNDHPKRLAQLLRAGGATAEVIFQHAGHGLIPADLASSKAWLDSGS
jgi:phospholipase/carboxylesterase